MLARENEASADAFEAAHPDFRPVPVAEVLSAPQLTEAARARFAELGQGTRLRLSPASADTDGFFAAVYERAA
jgi:16S rRNA (cytosine967-C5)-methyltransferase